MIDGKPAAMVAYFVYKNSEDRVAVLGVLLGNPGNLLPREYEFWSYVYCGLIPNLGAGSSPA